MRANAQVRGGGDSHFYSRRTKTKFMREEAMGTAD
jgi:hypothetical protein